MNSNEEGKFKEYCKGLYNQAEVNSVKRKENDTFKLELSKYIQVAQKMIRNIIAEEKTSTADRVYVLKLRFCFLFMNILSRHPSKNLPSNEKGMNLCKGYVAQYMTDVEKLRENQLRKIFQNQMRAEKQKVNFNTGMVKPTQNRGVKKKKFLKDFENTVEKNQSRSWNVSNVALIGSRQDLQQRVDTAKKEIEWKGAGQKDGIEVWRIENFGVKRWPRNKYGQFYGGDCYIVLHTRGRTKWDVYYWIGGESTVDEQGTAALKTIELDDFLGTCPIQYRETQGHESQNFLGLFPKGIRILLGGIDSGFRHVEKKEYKPRLLWIKGKKHVRATEVPLSASSLNTGDAFILDCGHKVLIWIPKGASGTERFKSAQVAQEIRNSRRGKLAEERLDQGGSDEFWKLLGGKPQKLKSEKEVQSDDDFDNFVGQKFPKIMFKLSDETGRMKFEMIQSVDKDSKLDRRNLDTMDVFCIDAGEEIIAWIGKKTSPDERKKAILYATNFIGMQKKPVWTRVVRVQEGREGPSFNDLFN